MRALTPVLALALPCRHGRPGRRAGRRRAHLPAAGAGRPGPPRQAGTRHAARRRALAPDFAAAGRARRRTSRRSPSPRRSTRPSPSWRRGAGPSSASARAYPDGRCPRRSSGAASRLLAAGQLRPHRPRRRHERPATSTCGVARRSSAAVTSSRSARPWRRRSERLDERHRPRASRSRRPPAPDVGKPGWFLTRSLPVTFADPTVTVGRRACRRPATSSSPPTSSPIARRSGSGAGRSTCPRSCPSRPARPCHHERLRPGLARRLGPHVRGPDRPHPARRTRPAAPRSVPRRSAESLCYAGCATGRSASLGLTVIVRQGSTTPTTSGCSGTCRTSLRRSYPPTGDDPIRRRGRPARRPLRRPGRDERRGASPARMRPSGDLFMSILRGAVVSPDGEITARDADLAEPLRGPWRLRGLHLVARPGRGRACGHAARSSALGLDRADATRSGTHVPFGDPLVLSARVRDSADIAEVRFRVYYPEWARPGAALLEGFDPRSTWRQVAVCRPPARAACPRGRAAANGTETPTTRS